MSNIEKNIGGDLWWIYISGFFFLVLFVFDYGNGLYEVLFFIMEYGDYEVKIFLDYIFCNGFKDLLFYWFKEGRELIEF